MNIEASIFESITPALVEYIEGSKNQSQFAVFAKDADYIYSIRSWAETSDELLSIACWRVRIIQNQTKEHVEDVKRVLRGKFPQIYFGGGSPVHASFVGQIKMVSFLDKESLAKALTDSDYYGSVFDQVVNALGLTDQLCLGRSQVAALLTMQILVSTEGA